MNGEKEAVYDAEIAPFMSQIIEICKRANIAVHAGFALDGDLACTTHVYPERGDVPSEDLEGYDQWRASYRAAMQIAAREMPITMITTRDASGRVTKMEAIL